MWVTWPRGLTWKSAEHVCPACLRVARAESADNASHDSFLLGSRAVGKKTASVKNLRHHIDHLSLEYCLAESQYGCIYQSTMHAARCDWERKIALQAWYAWLIMLKTYLVVNAQPILTQCTILPLHNPGILILSVQNLYQLPTEEIQSGQSSHE